MVRCVTLISAICIGVVLQCDRVTAIRNLQIASPLQVFTVWDKEVVSTGDEEQNDGELSQTPRSRFLQRYRVGLEAESSVRKRAAEFEKQNPSSRLVQVDAQSKDWAKQADRVFQLQRRKAQEKAAEAAFDRAVEQHDVKQAFEQLESFKKTKKGTAYQVVGVVNPSSSAKPVSWYARKKPIDAKWSARVVHVNRDAIVKDLFQQGKIDIFAKYENTGRVDPKTGTPVVTSKYYVKERSFKNLWNFSPKHFFTDSSGMYWRERRLQEGLYTDGQSVYESTYRHWDGRNGMRRLSSLQQYLGSKSVDSTTRKRALGRLKKDSPDIVLEE